jgi:hypothetical protein
MDIGALAEEVRVEGFCVLRRHFSRSKMLACGEAFAPLLDERMEQIRNAPNRGPMRHYIPLPLSPPFYDKEVFDDDAIHALLVALLGPDMTIGQFASDTPLLGSTYQGVHADMAPLFPDQPHVQHPPFLICVNFPFCDVRSAERGPFEVARRSHLL